MNWNRHQPIAPVHSLSGSFAARAQRVRQFHQIEIENSLQAIGLLQAFFPASGEKVSEVLEILVLQVKQGKSLREAFQNIAGRHQEEIERCTGPWLQEVLSMGQNQDAAFFWEEALRLGIRLKQSRNEAAGAVVLRAVAGQAVSSEIRGKAALEYNVLAGDGNSGMQAEHRLSNLVQQVGDLRAILPVVGASVVGHAVGTMVLGRLAGSSAGIFSRNLGARLVAGTMSFLVETPVFAAGARYLNDQAETSLLHDIGKAGLWLGGMRTMGFLGQQVFLRMHRLHELGGAVRLIGLTKFTHAALPQLAMFGGMYGVHRLAIAFGLQPQGTGNVGDVLSSMVSLQVGANLGRRVLGPTFAAFEKEMGLRTNIFTHYGVTQDGGGARWNPPVSPGNARMVRMAVPSPGPVPALIDSVPRPMLMVDSGGREGGGGGWRKREKSRELLRIPEAKDPYRGNLPFVELFNFLGAEKVLNRGGDVIAAELTRPLEFKGHVFPPGSKIYRNQKSMDSIFVEIRADQVLGNIPFPKNSQIELNSEGTPLSVEFLEDRKSRWVTFYNYLFDGTDFGRPESERYVEFQEILFLKGNKVEIDPSGNPTKAYLQSDKRFDSIPCSKDYPVTFHPNRRLASGQLSRDFLLGGLLKPAGTRFELDPAGNVIRTFR